MLFHIFNLYSNPKRWIAPFSHEETEAQDKEVVKGGFGLEFGSTAAPTGYNASGGASTDPGTYEGPALM